MTDDRLGRFVVLGNSGIQMKAAAAAPHPEGVGSCAKRSAGFEEQDAALPTSALRYGDEPLVDMPMQMPDGRMTRGCASWGAKETGGSRASTS